MKKLSYLFIAIISFIGISSVKADSLSFSNYYNDFDFRIELYLNNKSIIDEMISLYEENYSNDYPYYFINIDSSFVILAYSSSNETYWSGDTLNPNVLFGEYFYVFSEGVIYNSSNHLPNFITLSHGSYLSGTIINHGFVYSNNPSTYDSILFPAYTSSNYDFSKSSFEIEEGDFLPGYVDLYNGDYERNIFDHYTEINLNNYPYVALSLKDYTLRNDNNNQFSTNIYTKGQLCLTPVYNYGMKEKVDLYSGYQIDRCSVVYDDFTPVRTYILKSDLENNSIYYLKAYDTNIENKVKVDNNIFNITYITSENADNPSVNVNGRNYPTIAYDDLTSSSTQSEEEGYISGESVNIVDYIDSGFSDFFSNPLKALKSVWSAILSILALISTFIALLPPTMQGFLYMSFALVIVLGMLKMVF